MHDDARGTEHDLETDASPDSSPDPIDEFDLDIQLFPGPAVHRIEAARTVVGTNCDTCMDPSETCQGNTCGRTCHTHCGSCGCVDSDHSCRGCPSPIDGGDGGDGGDGSIAQGITDTLAQRRAALARIAD